MLYYYYYINIFFFLTLLFFLPLSYKCSLGKNDRGENVYILGSDGRVISQLPIPVQMAYPVDPRYATTGGNKPQLSRSFSKALEALAITYGNGDMLSKLFYKYMGMAYENHALRYYGHKRPLRYSLPNEREFFGTYGLTGDDLRLLLNSAARSTLTPYKVSDFERSQIEIQMVGCDLCFSTDHTFETGKNYAGIRKECPTFAIQNALVDTGEVASPCGVPSTSLKDGSHALQAFARRANVNPQLVSTDTWPKGKSYYYTVFGYITGFLGLFHFLNRVRRTLRDRHVDFKKAWGEFLSIIYHYDIDDEQKLKAALVDGTLNGTPRSVDEVNEMASTSKYRNQYSKYLRKMIHGVLNMIPDFKGFKTRYKLTASEGEPPAEGRRDPVSTLGLFTPETHSSLQHAADNCVHLPHPGNVPPDLRYQELPPPPGATHNLSTYRSLTATEQYIESFHHSQAHFANTGTSIPLCDCLMQIGTAEYNVKMRHRDRLRREGDGELASVPYEWRKTPLHWNHSILDFINGLSFACGTGALFTNVKRLEPNNGEVFYSRYYYQQLERNKLQRPVHTAHPYLCVCDICSHDTFTRAVPLETEEDTQPSSASTNTIPMEIEEVVNATATPTNVSIPATNAATINTTARTITHTNQFPAVSNYIFPPRYCTQAPLHLPPVAPSFCCTEFQRQYERSNGKHIRKKIHSLFCVHQLYK